MPALIAMKRYPELAAKYIATRAAGKPHKLALAALMRKLIKLANTLVRNDGNGNRRPLDPDGYLIPGWVPS